MFEQISWWCKPGEIVIASDAAIECDSDFCNKLERGRSDHLRCARDRCTRFCPVCEHPQITSLRKISIGVAGSPSHPMPLRRPPNRGCSKRARNIRPTSFTAAYAPVKPADTAHKTRFAECYCSPGANYANFWIGVVACLILRADILSLLKRQLEVRSGRGSLDGRVRTLFQRLYFSYQILVQRRVAIVYEKLPSIQKCVFYRDVAIQRDLVEGFFRAQQIGPIVQQPQADQSDTLYIAFEVHHRVQIPVNDTAWRITDGAGPE